MDFIELLDFSSFISFSYDPWSLSSAFVSFLSHRWLFNVATSFVNGPYCVRVGRLAIVRIFQTVTHGRLNTVKVWAVWQIFCILLALFIQQFIKLRLQTKLSGKLSTSSRWHSENIQSHYQCISFVHRVIDSLHHPPARLLSSSEAWVQWFQWQWINESSPAVCICQWMVFQRIVRVLLMSTCSASS